MGVRNVEKLTEERLGLFVNLCVRGAAMAVLDEGHPRPLVVEELVVGILESRQRKGCGPRTEVDCTSHRRGSLAAVLGRATRSPLPESGLHPARLNPWKMVELRGIEPLTSALRTRRSPN